MSEFQRKIVLASANAGKTQEIVSLLSPLGFLVMSSKEIGFVEEIPETGETFAENALLKAKVLSRFSQSPVLSDDSGLEVEALGDAPGIYSARFAGPQANEAHNRQKLLETMQGKTNRRARFVCVLCYLKTNSKPYFFTGVCNGTIATEERGTQGFGYDSLFIPDGTTYTFAEMGSEIKARGSHRTLALYQWLKWLSDAGKI